MKRALLLVLTLTTATLSACGGGDDTPTPMASMASTASTAQFPQNADMWSGLGGDASAPAAIAKVVDDAVSGLLADPKEAPYFANLGQPGPRRILMSAFPAACSTSSSPMLPLS